MILAHLVHLGLLFGAQLELVVLVERRRFAVRLRRVGLNFEQLPPRVIERADALCLKSAPETWAALVTTLAELGRWDDVRKVADAIDASSNVMIFVVPCAAFAISV